MKKIRKIVVGLICTLCIMANIGMTAFADTEDQYFSFVVNSSGGNFSRNGEITSRNKMSDTKVYVYIKKAPYTYIQVKTWGKRQTASTYYNETAGGCATVQNGIQCSITNYIYENAGYKNTNAYITLRSAGSGGSISGCWSPDSTQNYTIVN